MRPGGDVEACDESLRGFPAGLLTPLAVALCDAAVLASIKRLRLPGDVADVIACVARLPKPATDAPATGTLEVIGDKPTRLEYAAHRLLDLLLRPCVDRWIARHEVVIPICGRPLHVCPISILRDSIVTRDHQPRLSTVICRDCDVHVDDVSRTIVRYGHMSFGVERVPMFP